MEIAADDLWAVEPSSFVAERDALAKRLRAEGDREGATEVKKRKRPPVSAWALNAVARDTPDLIDAVLDAGAALEAALQAGSNDRAARADAQQDERQATDELINRAADRIEAIGQRATDQFRARMVQTIRAAQLDEAVAVKLRAGVLADDETPSVFGFAAPPGQAAPARARPKPAAPRAKASDAPPPVAPAPEQVEAIESAEPAEAPAPKPVRRAVDKAAEKAAREQARAARVALAHQQEEARRLAKRAERLEERARELAADAQAAADEATGARADADRAAAALAEVESMAETDD